MEPIEKLHKIDLEIVKNVIKVFEKYDLKYFMLGGTMLGAIRHGGFIPWDDDIDLGMPRKDYEKFLEVAEDELPSHLQIVNYKNTSSYQYYITRVQNTDVKVIEERIGNDSKFTFASIDIFPIDGTPNNKLLRKIYYFRVLTHRALMSLHYKDSIDRKRKRRKLESAFIWVMEKIPFDKIINPYKEKEKIDRLLSHQNIDNSNYIGNIMGAYRTREIVPKEWYGEGTKYKFEDIELIGFDNYHEYLKYTYGNYMELPPVESRKTHYCLESLVSENE
ncbi:LicD family protein [Streptococcus sp. IsoGale021]|uniref:LicD family protein n=1 Tax=Streptococcus TaxID=1301 RepID=UPI00200066B3|nr:MULTISPECIES: LicD family protein [Streptococcus]MCY7209837.1 LicD family protein [Streptococcus anginosus]MCY7211410.1 LicD family protein [Streptococcus anginosus]MCY7226537.1 LicD family protein [Streptococcus anginosus]MDQ8693904.1 LicD family protein [Streptococcus sp. IsoGale021]MDU5128320.1 LicD family protein [Streptococcus anginosus]